MLAFETLPSLNLSSCAQKHVDHDQFPEYMPRDTLMQRQDWCAFGSMIYPPAPHCFESCPGGRCSSRPPGETSYPFRSAGQRGTHGPVRAAWSLIWVQLLLLHNAHTARSGSLNHARVSHRARCFVFVPQAQVAGVARADPQARRAGGGGRAMPRIVLRELVVWIPHELSQ